MTPDWKQMDVQTVGHNSPETLGGYHHYRDGDQSKCNEIPGVIIGEKPVKNEEAKGANKRSLDAAYSADDDDEK